MCWLGGYEIFLLYGDLSGDLNEISRAIKEREHERRESLASVNIEHYWLVAKKQQQIWCF